MSNQRFAITEFLQHPHQLMIDVRSPAEYQHAHMPGSVNIPLFDNEERKIVGTIYKQKSREDAIKIGLDLFGPKMRRIVEEVEGLLQNKKATENNSAETLDTKERKCVAIYCWRGGMRSAAIAWLLNLYGFNVVVLSSGYKAFRNHVLKTFTHPWKLNVLGGYTGSGKTELLSAIHKNGEAIIDLEALAVHKGSAFGNIDMPPQPAQEMFENSLALALNKMDLQQPIWIEDESQRIGNINIPGAFWQTIRQSPLYFIDVPFEERLEHIVEEYGQLNKEKVGDAIQRITKRLGGMETKNALNYLQENNWSACFAILLKYYDKHYFKSLHNRNNLSSLIKTIPCQQAGGANVDALLNQTLA